MDGVPDTYQSNIENNSPSAWRIWWVWAPGKDTIHVLEIGPHPSNNGTH